MPGFTGAYCETIVDACFSSPCGANGVCNEAPAGCYTCTCQPGYTGTK